MFLKAGEFMFISFIIPIYNTEKYLRKCLDSILNQDINISDYEVVCVNDGSTDGSLDILQQYVTLYSNVILVNQKNSGVCAARNAGINASHGDYIWFIDSDDYIQPKCLGEIMNQINNMDYDRIIVGNYYFPDNIEQENSTDDLISVEINTSWHDSVVWRSILKKEFITQNNLYFHYPELTYGEDALYMYEIKRYHPKTLEIQKAIYFHRGRVGSAGTEEDTPEAKKKKLISNLPHIKEAQVIYDNYKSGDDLPETADRMMVFLWGTMFRIAELTSKDAKPYLNELKVKGLYPYKCPSKCTITQSHQLDRNDLVQKVFDYIYTNTNLPLGYHAMRLWIRLFRLKHVIFH